MVLPDLVDPASRPSKPLTQALDDGNFPADLLTWGWEARAMLALRMGDPESAVEYVSKSEASNPPLFARATNQLLLSMAESQREHADQARSAFNEATKLIGTLPQMGRHPLIKTLLQEANTKLETDISRVKSVDFESPGD